MITSFDELIAFLRRYHRHRLADPSLAPSRIPAELPPALARFHRELGALGDDTSERNAFYAQDQIVPVDRLTFADGQVTFAWENQGNWSARCAVGEGDPPVLSNAGGRSFRVVCPSLEHFLTTLGLQEAVFSSPHLFAINQDVAIDKVLAEPVQPLWRKGTLVYGKSTHAFHVSADGNVIVMSGQIGLWVGSRERPVRELLAEGVTDVNDIGSSQGGR